MYPYCSQTKPRGCFLLPRTRRGTTQIRGDRWIGEGAEKRNLFPSCITPFTVHLPVASLRLFSDPGPTIPSACKPNCFCQRACCSRACVRTYRFDHEDRCVSLKVGFVPLYTPRPFAPQWSCGLLMLGYFDAIQKPLTVNGSLDICQEEEAVYSVSSPSTSEGKGANMNKFHGATLQPSLTHLTESLRKDFNLPRYVSLETASSALHLSSSQSKQWISSQVRPRRCFTESDIKVAVERKTSFRDDIGHAAAETYLITKLTFTLLKYLGIGYRWLIKLCALGFYALFLMPGFLQVGFSYFFDRRIHRSITYGSKPRNRLDLYLPEKMDSPKPVVVFVTGGAWIIGYKAWGTLLGLQLVEKDVIVACIDYRNFPQGTITDMVEDVMQGLSFICNNAADLGGDPDRLYVAGQSAGAHLVACALIEQALKESSVCKRPESTKSCEGEDLGLSWRASQFKAYFAISGGYNLKNLVDYFHDRGLYRRLFLSIMEGEESLLRYSPEHRVQSLSGFARSLLPPFHLFHGTADYSIPCDESTSFANALASTGAHVTTRLYEDKTHTDLFLQDPMRGGQDALLEDILAVVHAGDKEALVKDALSEPRRRLVPELLLKLARFVSPF